jgi:hypothetical protein
MPSPTIAAHVTHDGPKYRRWRTMASRYITDQPTPMARGVLPTYGQESHRRNTAPTDKKHQRNTVRPICPQFEHYHSFSAQEPHLVALARGQHPSFARKMNTRHRGQSISTNLQPCTIGSPHGDDRAPNTTASPSSPTSGPTTTTTMVSPRTRGLSIDNTLQPCTIGSTRGNDDPASHHLAPARRDRTEQCLPDPAPGHRR